MATVQFDFVDGTRELVNAGSPRYRELTGDGHTPVGTVPESDGISDRLQEYLGANFAPFLFGPRVPSLTRARSTKRTLYTAFQSGHGWTVNSGAAASSSLNDSANAVYGDQCVTLSATNASGSFNFRSPAFTSVDLTGKNLCVLMQVTGIQYLTDLRIQVGDTGLVNGRTVKVPYNTADGQKSYIKEGEWQWVEVCPEDGSNLGTGQFNGVTQFQFRIQAPSAGGTVTVRLGGWGYRPRVSEVTSGILCFTFDDSLASQFTIAKPMLDKKGWAATAFPIAEKVDGGANYLTTAQVQAMSQLSGWEFGVHSMTTAGHDAGFTALPDAALVSELVNGRDFLHGKGLGASEGFAWPLGTSSTATERSASKVQAYARSNTPEGFETLPVANPMRIRSIPISSSTTDTLINGYIDQAVAANKLLCLTIHDVVASGASGSTQMNAATLQSIVDKAASTGIQVMTLSEALRVR